MAEDIAEVVAQLKDDLAYALAASRHMHEYGTTREQAVAQHRSMAAAASSLFARRAPLLSVDRFVDEVEQVRQALGLDSSNFVLLGQSWGGLLAMEYAVHHQDKLKGLVISNMMSSSRLYNQYAHEVLMPTMDPSVLAQIKGFEAEVRQQRADRHLRGQGHRRRRLRAGRRGSARRTIRLRAVA